jgi:hypothetical protein
MTPQPNPVDLDQVPVDNSGQPDPYHNGDYAQTEQPNKAQLSRYNSFLPVIGGLVQVSFFDGAHVIRNAFAHVLSVSPAAEDELPTVTVVYPKQPVVDTRNLAGPDWAKAFERQAGVPHITHEAIQNRTSSIAYMALYDSSQGNELLENLFEAPEGDPALLQADGQKRQLNPEALKDSIQMATAAQSGSMPTPTVKSPLVNDHLVYETKQYADGSSATGIAPLPDESPDGAPRVQAGPAVVPTEADQRSDEPK